MVSIDVLQARTVFSFWQVRQHLLDDIPLTEMSSIFPPKRQAPWLDLPTPLTELILERLPLSDYLRFATICKKWHSIQQEHRLRHAPNPPPMLPLPWLVSPVVQKDGIFFCYSLFEQRSYRVRVPNSQWYGICRFFPNGWLLLGCSLSHLDSETDTTSFFLANLISGARIWLPPLRPAPKLTYYNFPAAMSMPCSAEFVVLIVEEEQLFLFRAGDPEWTKLPQPGKPLRALAVKDPVCHGGKFYCLVHDGSFLIVDPFPQPAIEVFGMNADQLLLSSGCPAWHKCCLLECRRDLLMVEALLVGDYSDVDGFKVSKADLVRREWRNIDDIGDQILILHGRSRTAVLAADVGGRGNCVYFRNSEFPYAWRLFDLGTGRLSCAALLDTLLETELGRKLWSSMYRTVPSIC